MADLISLKDSDHCFESTADQQYILFWHKAGKGPVMNGRIWPGQPVKNLFCDVVLDLIAYWPLTLITQHTENLTINQNMYWKQMRSPFSFYHQPTKSSAPISWPISDAISPLSVLQSLALISATWGVIFSLSWSMMATNMAWWSGTLTPESKTRTLQELREDQEMAHRLFLSRKGLIAGNTQHINVMEKKSNHQLKQAATILFFLWLPGWTSLALKQLAQSCPNNKIYV